MICKHQKRTIGLFLFICMLLLGICLENVQTYSLSAYASSELSDSPSAHPESEIVPAGKTFPVQRFMPGKTFASENAVVNTRRGFSKTSCRTGRQGFAFLCAFLALLHKNSSTHSFLAHEISFNIPKHIIIIQYIHFKDGQKSDFLFS